MGIRGGVHKEFEYNCCYDNFVMEGGLCAVRDCIAIFGNAIAIQYLHSP